MKYVTHRLNYVTHSQLLSLCKFGGCFSSEFIPIPLTQYAPNFSHPHISANNFCCIHELSALLLTSFFKLTHFYYMDTCILKGN